jgi:hypothetical protein
MVAALVRPLFNADGGEQARELVGDALQRLRKPLPNVAALLEEVEEDLLAFYSFPTDHRPKLRSTNPLERVNRKIGPPHRRGRHLSQRPLAHPARRQRRHRATTSGWSAAATLLDSLAPLLASTRRRPCDTAPNHARPPSPPNPHDQRKGSPKSCDRRSLRRGTTVFRTAPPLPPNPRSA